MRILKVIIIVLAIIIALFLIYSLITPIKNTPYLCTNNSDCTSTCGMKCVNSDWARNYNDSCVNVRAYECSCTNNLCYSDGKVPNK